MHLFFELASPTTLASLIADIDKSGRDTTTVKELRNNLVAALTANVGDDEAIEMIHAAGVGI